MRFDKLDKHIINSIYEGYENKEEVTTWLMAKKLLNTDVKHEITDLCNKIKFRLEAYSKKGFIIKDRNSNGKIKYILNIDLITIKKVKFSDGIKKALVIRM